jgi:hypothetical protein
MITIDGNEYASIVAKISRDFNIVDTDNSGRLSNGDMFREIIGTFYHHTLTIDGDFDPEEYTSLYEVLSDPVESHEITVPHGDGTLTYNAYVTSGTDTYINGAYNGLSCKFIAMDPQRRAT